MSNRPIQTFDVDSGHCLNCKAPMTAATNTTANNRPEPGCVTICLYCGHVMQFGDDMKLVEPSDECLVSLAGDQDFLRAMKIAGLYQKFLASKQGEKM